MLAYFLAFVAYTIFLCYFHYQYSKVKKHYSINWNGYKYIVRDNKGKFILMANGKFNGMFDIISLGETL